MGARRSGLLLRRRRRLRFPVDWKECAANYSSATKRQLTLLPYRYPPQPPVRHQVRRDERERAEADHQRLVEVLWCSLAVQLTFHFCCTGIWMSKGEDMPVLVMDVEGTDGRERGEDQVGSLLSRHIPSNHLSDLFRLSQNSGPARTSSGSRLSSPSPSPRSSSSIFGSTKSGSIKEPTWDYSRLSSKSISLSSLLRRRRARSLERELCPARSPLLPTEVDPHLSSCFAQQISRQDPPPLRHP